MVVKPVWQISVYEVTITVVIVSGDEVGAEVTEGEAVMVAVFVVPSPPLGYGRRVPLIVGIDPAAPVPTD